MALLLPLTVVAITYYANRGKDYGDPEFDLEGKTAVELLPSENELMLSDKPLDSVTYFDGDPKKAAQLLKARIQAILEANPWLAGRVHVEKKNEVKIWYDETLQDPAPNIFAFVEDSSDSRLSRDTPYDQCTDAFQEYQVKEAADLIGKNEPIWRVTVIPDAKDPVNRFAVVMSFSRTGGDPSTFYQVHNMLNPDAPIRRLNPVRKMGSVVATKEKLGQAEASYMSNVSSNPLWSLVKSETPVVQVFSISSSWIAGQRLMAKMQAKKQWKAWLKGARDRAAERSSQCCFSLIPNSFRSQDDDVLEDDGQINRSVVVLTNHDIIASWFWRTIGIKVGLLACDMRYHLAMLDEEDAGHYRAAIPFGPQDFASPDLVHEGALRARRVGATGLLHRTKLPKQEWDTTYNFVITFPQQEEISGIGTQHRHFPVFSAKTVHAVPTTLSVLCFFPVDKSGKMTAFLLAAPSLHETVEASGMIDETFAKY